MKDITSKNVILFGVGGTQKALLGMIDKYFKITPSNMLMIDVLDYRLYPDVEKWLKRGAKYLMCDINKEYKNIIKGLNKFDIIIDLSNRTDTLSITKECLENNIHYINTSLEDPISPNAVKKEEGDLEQTYQHSHNVVNTYRNQFKDHATSLMCFGMNPGLITIMTKQAILYLAKQQKKTKELVLYMNERDYARMCEYLQVEIIHCSEVDTAMTKEPVKNFTNTWCCQGLIDEYADNCQLTWGTDQQHLPMKAEMLSEYVADLNIKSKDMFCESYVPKFGKIIGCIISHSEQISGADYYSTPEHSPTIHYVYKLSPVTQYSIKKFLPAKLIGGTFPRGSTTNLNKYDTKFESIDAVGSLIITKDKKCVWAGSFLDSNEKWIGNASATTYQVALAIVSGLSYMLDHPSDGLLWAEDVDEDYILKIIQPEFSYLIQNCDYKPKSLQFQDMVKSRKEYEKQF